jgi:hypothetical protein
MASGVVLLLLLLLLRLVPRSLLLLRLLELLLLLLLVGHRVRCASVVSLARLAGWAVVEPVRRAGGGGGRGRGVWRPAEAPPPTPA